ncbi:MAG: hypothetical protein J2P32_13215, partial [Actinobacteria bacterium]|nr:hypothetical protein [Actinomycetota bacterium]
MSKETRERVRRLAREEFGGAAADETIRRLLDEHWEAAALAAVRRYRSAPSLHIVSAGPHPRSSSATTSWPKCAACWPACCSEPFRTNFGPTNVVVWEVAIGAELG